MRAAFNGLYVPLVGLFLQASEFTVLLLLGCFGCFGFCFDIRLQIKKICSYNIYDCLFTLQTSLIDLGFLFLDQAKT